jgi:hypothetical protein
MNTSHINELKDYIKYNYEDLEKSIKVFRTYHGDFIPSCYVFRSVVLNTSNSVRLDILLDQALTRFHPKSEDHLYNMIIHMLNDIQLSLEKY